MPYFLKQQQKRKTFEILQLREKSEKRKQHYHRIQKALAKKR